MAEMYVQGVSTRKVKAITEELCGHEFSASTISRVNQTLDEELDKFAPRKLEEAYPYLILDARYEKVREDGAVSRQLSRRGSGGDRDQLPARRWECVVSDDHAGLKKPSRKCCRKRPGSAAMFTSCATRWITCRGKPTTIA